jgi:hypothetical protein
MRTLQRETSIFVTGGRGAEYPGGRTTSNGTSGDIDPTCLHYGWLAAYEFRGHISVGRIFRMPSGGRPAGPSPPPSDAVRTSPDREVPH